MYDFDLGKVNREIKRRKTKRVLIQLPEGLKPHARQIMENINAECVLSADACYGACDVRESPGFLTVHFGHTKFVKNSKAVYVPAGARLDCGKAVRKALRLLPEKNVGLVTTAQHLHALADVRRVLESAGKKVFVAKGMRTAEGQVLGCDVGAALKTISKVDAFLFLGSGRFHAAAVAARTGKRVVQANPYSGAAGVVKAPDWEKEKWLRVEKAGDAHVFGVIVCSKQGQKNLRTAKQVKRGLESKGRKAYFILADDVSPEKLDYLPFDAFVIAACPMLVLDDWKNYKKPVLLPDEVMWT